VGIVTRVLTSLWVYWVMCSKVLVPLQTLVISSGKPGEIPFKVCGSECIEAGENQSQGMKNKPQGVYYLMLRSHTC